MKLYKNISIITFAFLLLIINLSAAQQPVEEILKRSDKHFLGGGKMVVWAPEFPQFLEHPGFWDHASFLEKKVEPIFTMTFLDENLKEIPLTLTKKEWLPSHLTLSYNTATDLEFREQKALLPGDVLASRFQIKNNTLKKKKVHIVVWTCQKIQTNAMHKFPEQSKNANFIHSLSNSKSHISWERLYNDADAKLDIKVSMALGADRIAQTTAVNVSTNTWNYPYWKLTPFYEKMIDSGLPNEENFNWRANPNHFNGLLYIGLHYILDVPPEEQKDFSAYCAMGISERETIEAFDATLKQSNPIQISIDNWANFFKKVPRFTCSDPYLEKYYYYRWYGLRLNMVDTKGEFNLPYPCIYEGINAGWFRHQISYGTQAHILETRWMHDPNVAKGAFLNFIHNQRKDGSYPGALRRGFEKHIGFYHVNWGKVTRDFYRIHPDQEFLKQAYSSLVRYANYFDRERDKENMNLYDVINHWETGQEYMSRYLFVDPESDKGGEFQLKGVDATVYIYELQNNLAWMATELSKPDEAKKWSIKARQTGDAILTNMWDDQQHFFFDINPKTGEKSPYKAAIGFYPFFTDLVTEKHITALTDHLFNPDEFWTNYPLPSSSLDDPNTNIFGDWKKKRQACPWNGKSWLMTTSHVCDGLAYTAQRLEKSLKPKAVELINRFIHTLFLDGDLNRPSSYEYYNPINGIPPYFREADDYMHSWINDLIIKYVVGLQPSDANKIIIDPLPFDLDFFTLDDVLVKGHYLKILWRKEDTTTEKKGLYIFVDGQLVKHSKKLARIEMMLE